MAQFLLVKSEKKIQANPGSIFSKATGIRGFEPRKKPKLYAKPVVMRKSSFLRKILSMETREGDDKAEPEQPKQGESPSEKREFTAESLESRILYSAAPMDADPGDPSVADVLIVELDQPTGDSFQSFSLTPGKAPIAPAETEVTSSPIETLSSFDDLSPKEITHLAETTVDYWKGDKDLNESQVEAIEALETAVTHFDGLVSESGAGLVVDLGEDGSGTYFDEGLLSTDFDFADLDGAGLSEASQFGSGVIAELIEEVAHPDSLKMMIEDLVADRTFDVADEQIPITYDTLDELIAASVPRDAEPATDVSSIPDYSFVNLESSYPVAGGGYEFSLDLDDVSGGKFIEATELQEVVHRNLSTLVSADSGDLG